MSNITGEEIANELGITRQAVSQALKRAVAKIFIEAEKLRPELDAWLLLGYVLETLNIQPDDYAAFAKMIPAYMRKRIQHDHRVYHR